MPNTDTMKTIASTEVHYLHSDIVGDDYKIFVAKPPYPMAGDMKLPVVYALDANGAFASVVETARMLQLGGEMPSCYVVGIGYCKGSFPETMTLRARDYTPTQFSRFERGYPQIIGSSEPLHTGGAAAFLRFIREELKPWVVANFPGADANDATLTGTSFGGLFTVYSMLRAPDTFQRYLACSPSLLYDDEVMFALESESATTHIDLPLRAFFSCGAQENETEMMRALEPMPAPLRNAHQALWRLRMVELLTPFVAVLRKRNYPGLRLDCHVFEGENHMSVYPAALSRGLRSLFRS